MNSTAPDKPPSQPRFQAGNLLGIIAYLRRYPVRVSLCFGLLLINIGIEMKLPQILGNAINHLGAERADAPPFSPWPYLSLFLGLVVLRAITGAILGPVRNRVVQSTLGDIRSDIYSSIQRLAFSYHDRTRTGELISRATTDVWRLQDFLFASLLLSVDIMVSLAVTTVLIFLLSPLLGWLAVCTMVPTILLIAFYARKLHDRWRKVHDLHGAMTTVVQENIAGVRVVKAFAKEQAEISKFRRRKETYLATLLENINYWAARVPFAQFIFGLSLPLVLWLGGRDVIQGKLLVGDLAKVVFYLGAIGHRIGMVGQFMNIIQNARASAERVLEIIHEPTKLPNGKLPVPVGKGRVEFDHVSFAYREGGASLTDVSLEARPGETIAIMGPTGSGKSTLVNLIPRFYDPTTGRILIDGADIRQFRLADLRREVAIIFQEPFLFSASVAENISYGKPSTSMAEIEACARAAQAHEFIVELERGYDTIIGERGVSLSGGQRQRIAIARAFLMNPRILILDDATSSVDSKTERQLQTAMRELCRNRTTFVIAQRFSTVQHADQILVLDQGRIVDRGAHAELVDRSGFYRQLFEQQIKRSLPHSKPHAIAR